MSKHALAVGRTLLIIAGATLAPGLAEEKSRPAPYFILPTVDGKTVKSTSLKGQVILLEFFQTWCPDCQEMAPQLERLYQKYKNKGLAIVGVSHDKDAAGAVAPFVKKYGVTYPVVMGDLSVAIHYIGTTPQVPTFPIPYLFLIDRQGNIVGEFKEGTHKEATDMKLLEERIKKLL